MSTTQEILEIIIQGTDKASGEFGKASTALEKLGGIGKGILTVGMAAAAAGVAALGAGLGIAVSEAMEAQAGLAQLDAVLKSTGGAAGVTRNMALELADSLSGVTRFSDDAVLSAENLLLTFTNIGEDVFPRATETLLDMATTMGTDAKSGAIQLGKALNDPVAGITALTRVGVTFTDEQKKMIEQMVAMGDVAGAQTIILDELQKEFGGSAEAAGQTFAGQLDILKNSLLNVAEGVGMALLPLLQDLTGFVTENVLPWIQGVGEEFSRLLGIFQEVGWKDFFVTFEDGSSWVGSFFETLGFGEETANKIGDAINNLVQWLGTNLPIAFQAVSDFWTTTLYPALQEIWNWLSINLPLAVQTLSDFWTGTLQPALTQVWEWITINLLPIFTELYTWAQNNLPSALQQLSDFWTGTLLPAITQVWQWATTTLFPALQELWDWLAPKLTSALTSLGDFWVNTLLPAVLSVWSWVINTLFPMLTTLWDWLSTKLTAALQTLSDYWETTLKPALEIVWDFAKESLVPLFEKVSELFGTTLLLAVTSLSDYWNNTLYPALEDVWDLVKTYLQPVLDNLSAFFAETIGPAVLGVMPTLESLQSFFDGLKTTVSGLIGFVQTLINKINAIPGMPGSGTTDDTDTGNNGGFQVAGGTTPAGAPAMGTSFSELNKIYETLSAKQKGLVQSIAGQFGSVEDFGRAINMVLNKEDAPTTDPRSRNGSSGGGTSKGGTEYHLHINTTAGTENILDDFAMLEALAAG